MEDVFNFNGLFGRIAPGMCRIDMKGRIAVKTSNGYKAYDLDSQRLVNCSSFCFDLGEDMFFLIPTSDVEVGDIILVNRTPRCVIKVNDRSITVLNYENSTIEEIVPERHVFMGNTYFYGKIVSILSGMMGDSSDGNGFSNIIKFKMMSSMLNGGSSKDSMLLPLMMMSGGNPLGDMFGGLFRSKKEKPARSRKTKKEE